MFLLQHSYNSKVYLLSGTNILVSSMEPSCDGVFDIDLFLFDYPSVRYILAKRLAIKCFLIIPLKYTCMFSTPSGETYLWSLYCLLGFPHTKFFHGVIVILLAWC